MGLGLSNAHQLWQEYTFPILDWAHQQNGIAGFAHMQYLDGNGLPQSLTCCTPIEYPVEVALGAADFISEDVDNVNSGAGMHPENFLQAYYQLLNSGFRPGFAAGTDYPCNGSDDGGALGALLTYVQVARRTDDVPELDRRHRERADRRIAEWTQRVPESDGERNRHPGDEIELSGSGTVNVTVQWTATENLSGTIELVQNGTVIASRPNRPALGSPGVSQRHESPQRAGGLQLAGWAPTQIRASTSTTFTPRQYL